MSNEREIEISIEQLQELKEQCRNKISMEEALNRLTKNPDFKKVFMEEYVDKEPVRLVKLLGDSSINLGNKQAEHRNDIHERMIGIARFAEYMRSVESIAIQAENTLESIRQSETEMI